MYRAIGLAGSLLLAAVLSACGGGGESSGVVSSPSGGSAISSSGLATESSKEFALPTQAETLTKTATGVETDAALRPLAVSPFARTDTYEVYAANGSKKLLRLNFASRQYEMLDAVGQSTSGTFSEDANEPGTYVFASSRIASSTNTARFRVAQGAIVGAFPFEKPWSDPVAYPVAPFVAANDFVGNPAELDGDYNRLGISLSSNGTADSQVLPLRISSGGTVLEMCSNDVIYQVSLCPAASKLRYALTPSADSTWTGTSTTNPSDVLQFRMARINGQNVWLSGGWTAAAPNTHVFRVGLKDSASGWSADRSRGAATDGSWGSNTLSATASTRSSVSPDGTTRTRELPVSSLDAPAPVGLRAVNANGSDKYLAGKSAALSVIMGARNPNTRGYIEINLFKEQLDARSGRYTVFASNGTEQTLDIDFVTQRYAMSAPGGDAVTGVFAEDANDRGTYIVASERIGTVANTARFRTTTDAIVGAFPFAVFKSQPIVHVAQPFIAARSFVTDKSQLAGLYDVLVTSRMAAPDLPLQVAGEWQLKINASGTLATQCSAGASANCKQPGAAPLSYDFPISPGASPGIWLLGNSENPAFTVRIAKIGGRRVLLEAKETLVPTAQPPYGAPASMLLTGLAQSPSGSGDANWPALNMHSASTASSFGTAITDTTSYTTHYLLPDGTSTDLTLALQPVAGNPQMRQGLDSNGNKYFLVQNGAILFMAPGRPAIPYLHIGLAD